MARNNDTNTFVLTLGLNTKLFENHILDSKFEVCRKIQNAITNKALKRYEFMTSTKQYQIIQENIKITYNKLNNCTNPKNEKELKKILNDLYKVKQQIIEEYSLTEYSLHDVVKSMYNHFKINSHIAQKLATRVSSSIDDLIYGKADKLHFKKYDCMTSIEGKTNAQGIIYDNDKKIVKMFGLKIEVIINHKDVYAEMALLNRVKYCRILRKYIHGKTKYYIQLVLDGIPPVKYNKDGSFRHKQGTSRVGIDIGIQSIAIVSKTDTKLLELCPRVNKIDKELRRINRAMDRSRRATNTDNYSENGTIKKGIINDKGKKEKLVWMKSNNYKKLQNQRKELYRVQKAIRRQDHNILANYIISLGIDDFVETMNYAGLQKRAKKTTVNEKTGKINKKKRFGKSLANKAPAMFLTILNNKLKWLGKGLIKINTREVKASQYNHLNQKYNKKKLSQRWNKLEYNGKQIKIQRDCYSAFLIMCVNDSLNKVNDNLCNIEFDNFIKLHDIEIDRLRNSNNKKLSSMGI
jgi:hypothetical protein